MWNHEGFLADSAVIQSTINSVSTYDVLAVFSLPPSMVAATL